MVEFTTAIPALTLQHVEVTGRLGRKTLPLKCDQQSALTHVVVLLLDSTHNHTVSQKIPLLKWSKKNKSIKSKRQKATHISAVTLYGR